MSGNARKRFGILKVSAIVVVVLLATAIALPFVLDANQFRPELESKLSAALGRQVKLGNIKLSILSGSLAVEDISIADNPSFSRSPFVNARSLRVAVALKPLIFSKSIRVAGITLERPSIILIRDKSGNWNFSDLGSGDAAVKPPDAGESGSFSGKDVSIEELKIVEGKATLIHAGESRKPSVYNNVNITAGDLSYASAFPFSMTASLPGGGSLELEGKAGPLNERDILMTPLAAELAVKHFDLIASGFVEPESGLAGLFDFSGTVTSDGRKVLSKGQASADRLQLVRSGSPAGRPVSLKYAVTYDLERRNGTLSDASVGYGKAIARLDGDYEMRGGNLVLKMTLRGTNMPVEDLAALLPAFGVTLPKGAALQGGSLTANLVTEGPIEKLVTTGTADISGTRLVGFDLSGKMAAVARLAGLRSSQETEIEKFASGLRMTPEGIQVNNLLLIMPALGRLSGDGTIAGDQSLNFTMRALLKPGSTIGAGLARLVKGGELDVPFFVRGNASDPKFVPDVRKAAGGLLGSALGQGSEEGQTGTGGVLGNTLRNFLQKKK